jgi:Flp pilus assembly protein TadG
MSTSSPLAVNSRKNRWSVSGKHAQRWLRDRRGASAVEFALVAPAFSTMLIGLFVLGWSMHCISSLRLALEESGRALQIDQTLTATQLTALVRGELRAIGDPNVTVKLADDTSIAGVKMARITWSSPGFVDSYGLTDSSRSRALFS